MKTKESKNLNEYSLENYIDYYQAQELSKTIGLFDLYLKNNYRAIPKPEDRIYEFLFDYFNVFYTNSTDSNKSRFIKDLSIFNLSIKRLDSIKFTNYLYNKGGDIPKDKYLLKWKDSILKKNNLENIFFKPVCEDSLIKKASNFDLFRYYLGKQSYFKQFLNEYYYALHHLAQKKDGFIKEWVESIIVEQNNRMLSLKSLLEIKPRKKLNNPLCKALIFTELILPFYDFESQELIKLHNHSSFLSFLLNDFYYSRQETMELLPTHFINFPLTISFDLADGKTSDFILNKKNYSDNYHKIFTNSKKCKLKDVKILSTNSNDPILSKISKKEMFSGFQSLELKYKCEKVNQKENEFYVLYVFGEIQETFKLVNIVYFE